MTDMHKVLGFVKTQSTAPVWIFGTRRSTISATATAIIGMEKLAVDTISDWISNLTH